jgi:hypothetical protein
VASVKLLEPPTYSEAEVVAANAGEATTYEEGLNRAESTTSSFWSYLYLAVLFGMLYGFAVALRYTSAWSEGDTSFFTRTITGLVEYGSLSPDQNRFTYPQGFVYQTWAASLVHLTGISVSDYIRWFSPVLGNAFLALFGFVAFRRLLRSNTLGLLTTFILFLIPELTFVVSRGNHEKLTVSFTLLAALAFFSSFHALEDKERKGEFLPWTLCYYFFIFAAAASNVYFGSTFVIAITFMFFGFGILQRIFPKLRNVLPTTYPRLGRMVLISWLIVFFDLFYLYPRSSDFLVVFKEVVGQLGNLFSPRINQVNPYARIGEVWRSLWAYRIVSLFRWILFAGAFLSWIGLTIHSLRQAKISLSRYVVLALYLVFNIILALGVPVDFLGLDVGSNLQVRLYIYAALFSAPLLAYGVAWLTSPARPGLLRRPFLVFLPSAFVFFALTSFLKLTQDPSVSNVWRFFEVQEASAVSFYLNHQLDRTRQLWIGPDDRLRHGYYVTFPSEALKLLYNPVTGEYNVAAVPLNSKAPLQTSDYALDSPLIRADSLSWQTWALPKALLGSQVYDNGQTAIRYTNPATPFLR